MRRSYLQELADLPVTYRHACSYNVSLLADLIRRTWSRPVIFVGSGGALAVARFAAELHERTAQTLACALTPLEFSNLPLNSDVGVIIFSASGRNPDVLSAVRSACLGQYPTVGLVTQQARGNLSPVLTAQAIEIVTVSVTDTRDGFLATNSVLGMSTGLARCHLGEQQALPAALPLLEHPVEKILRERCLVLYAPSGAAAARDLETRLHETGLAAVQLTDYRNLAHGRHVGLVRHLESTTVVAFIAPPYEALAESTLALLPSDTDIVQIRSTLPWPAAGLDLLAGSMHLTAATATAQGIDPARPSVKPFGRKLYHLSSYRKLPDRRPSPEQRKMAALGPEPVGDAIQQMYREALSEWLQKTAITPLGGMVLDYDGTCCTTEGRFEPPDETVRAELLQFLEAGGLLGFASGRGQSLLRDLRRWIPRDLWDRVHLGLYNGGLPMLLNQNLEDQRSCTGELAEAVSRLHDGYLGDVIKLEARRLQISAQVRAGISISTTGLVSTITEILARQPALPLKVVASAHSVDIVPAVSSKTGMLHTLQIRSGGEILAVGDQGQLGGNDFELLAATRLSLSVDRCSADPTRCWNLDTMNHRGPALLLQYLKALGARKGELHFVWRNR